MKINWKGPDGEQYSFHFQPGLIHMFLAGSGRCVYMFRSDDADDHWNLSLLELKTLLSRLYKLKERISSNAG